MSDFNKLLSALKELDGTIPDDANKANIIIEAYNRAYPLPHTTTTINATKSIKPSPPPKYTGHRNASAAEAWLRQVERYFIVTELDKQHWTGHASLLLTNGAQRWFERSKIALNADWQLFCSNFRKNFKPEDAVRQARIKLHNLKQGNSNIDTYVSNFTDIAMEIDDMEDTHLRDIFLNGLRNETRVQVTLSRPKKLEDAISAAEMVDRVIFEPQYISTFLQQPKQQQPRTNNNNNSLYTQDGPEPMILDNIHLNKLSNQDRDKLAKVGGCFRCRRIGHMARECPLNQVNNYNRNNNNNNNNYNNNRNNNNYNGNRNSGNRYTPRTERFSSNRRFNNLEQDQNQNQDQKQDVESGSEQQEHLNSTGSQ